jgi:hypothetical protein
MTHYDRTSITVGIILVGTILFLVLELPVRTFELTPLGTPLTFQITGSRIVSILLVGLSCSGTEAVMRTHPLVRRRKVRYTFLTWVLPALATLALTLYLPQSPSLFIWLAGLVLGGTAIAWLILVHFRMLDPDAQISASVRIARSLIAYLLILVFFTSIYRTRVRSLVTATSIAAVASVVSLTMLSDEARSLGKAVLYSGATGLILGEITWALNYWKANVVMVGVLLMLTFYVFVGITREHLRGTLTRRVLVEFLVVAGLGIWLTSRLGRW